VSWSSSQTFRARQPVGVTHTDLHGKCSIELASEGPIRVAVRREGYLDADDTSRFQHLETVEAVLGKTAKLFVDLVRAGSFQGTVYLEDGRRVAGAIVRLQPASLSATGTTLGTPPKWLTAKTDAQGNYGFPIVPPAQYGMWIEAPDKIVRDSLRKSESNEWTGYATAIWHSSVEELQRIVPVEVSPGEDVRGYNIVLRKTKVYPFQGALREMNGTPIVHAKVALRVGTGEPINLLEPRSVSPLNGEFEFPALPEGHYSLLVYRDDAPDSPPYAIPLEAGAADTSPGTRHVLRIPPWASVAGKVVIVRPDLTVPAKSAQSSIEAKAQTAPRRSINWWEPDPVHVWLTPIESKTPARGDTVSLQSAETRDGISLSFPSMMFAPGVYQFQVQTPELWYVSSAKAGDVDLLETRVLPLADRRSAIPAQFTVEIRQGGAALEGVVVNEKGEPQPSAAMCAMAEEPARRAQPGGAFCVHADGDGAFRSRWLGPGEWKVWALTRKPRENPASPAFQQKYERQARKLDVPEDGVMGGCNLVAIE
jgi:hypothetical protein